MEDWAEALLEPVCMGSIIRVDARFKGRVASILFANPDNLENELTSGSGHLSPRPQAVDGQAERGQLSLVDGIACAGRRPVRLFGHGGDA